MSRASRTLLAAAAAIAATGYASAIAQNSSFTPEERLEIERIVEEVVVSRMTGADESAPATLVDASEPERLVEIAALYGSATLADDAHGDPLLQGEIDGVGYEIFFYGCENARDCRNVMFRAVWESNDATTGDVMRWNQEKRFGKAYLDVQGNLVIEMNVNLDFGVSAENLSDTFDWWRVVLGDFVGFFGLS